MRNSHPATTVSHAGLALPAMELVSSPHSARVLARVLSITGIVFVLTLIFVPWQQSVSGSGQVTALTPIERTQMIASPVEARVLRWYVTEGSRVKAGDLIVDMTDNDPQIMERLRGERFAIEDRRQNALGRVDAHNARLVSLEQSRINAISASRGRAQMAADRVQQAEQAFAAAKERLSIARLNHDRQLNLIKAGLTSQRNVELAQLELATADAETRRTEAAVNAARREKTSLEDELRKVDADTAAAVQGERASLKTAQAEVSNVNAELQRIDVRVARQNTMRVTAPRSGTILRLLAQPNSELLKAGEPVAHFVPDAAKPTVELWLNGVDMPLVRPGDPVRLQFNGWPAIQFVGWPSVAIGTFGGTVQLVDATETQGGRFRVLVIPDESQDRWPSTVYLRQGVQAKGWVLLKTVPLGWELWRRFNGFPPVIAENEPGAKGKTEKKSK